MHPARHAAAGWQQQAPAQAPAPQQQAQPLSAPPAGSVATSAAAATGAGLTPGATSGAAALAARYDILSKIGEGTYGLVYLAAARDGSGRLYAIKTFKTGRVRRGVRARGD
jgi:hypothetical protein